MERTGRSGLRPLVSTAFVAKCSFFSHLWPAEIFSSQLLMFTPECAQRGCKEGKYILSNSY